MRYSSMLIRGIGISAMLFATPALAQSRIDRARTAVAEATAKIEAAQTAGAETHAPDTMARAQEALRVAKDQLDRDHRDSTINEARRASGLADQALAEAESHKSAVIAEERDRRAAAEVDANVAANDAAAERDQRVAAEQAASVAASNAEAARARAAAAQASAEAARAAALQPVTTTVTTVDRTTSAAPTRSYSRSKPAVRKTTPRKPAAPKPKAATTTTTTTVKTGGN